MDDILEQYTAGELLKWIEDEDMDIYLLPTPVMIDDESTIITRLDIEQIKTNFLRTVRRYTVVKRGKTFYIHDEASCQDIMSFRFDEETEIEVQNHVHNLVEDLNERSAVFIGKKHCCG